MGLLQSVLDFFFNLDTNLGLLVVHYGAWTYLILFLIIFFETGVVVAPFLPGDSLLFVAGTFAATDTLDPWLLFILLSAAAIFGDSVNYWIGHLIGPRVFVYEDHWFFKKKNLERTEKFYEKYGAKTIILARFVPIVRTLAPFVAGIGGMKYAKFFTYNLVGGIAWVGLAVWSGFFFGNLPWVKENFELVVLAVIFLSFLPPVVEWLRHRRGPTSPLKNGLF